MIGSGGTKRASSRYTAPPAASYYPLCGLLSYRLVLAFGLVLCGFQAVQAAAAAAAAAAAGTTNVKAAAAVASVASVAHTSRAICATAGVEVAGTINVAEGATEAAEAAEGTPDGITSLDKTIVTDMGLPSRVVRRAAVDMVVVAGSRAGSRAAGRAAGRVPWGAIWLLGGAD
jgi:hypothetical protein